MKSLNSFWQLTKRNMLLYFRDRGAVFFSLLSMFIIIALMLLFLGDMNINSITDMLTKLPDRDSSADKKNAELLLLSWTAAGVIPINSAMVALSTLSSLIRDKYTGRSGSIQTAPISRFTITLSYIAAACAASVVICTVTLAVSELYLCTKGMGAYTAAEHFKLLGMILVNSFTYSAMMYLCAVFVKSEGAWGGLGTVIGTLIGFLGGIYLPVGSLSAGLADFISCTPVIYGTVMFRKVMTAKIAADTFAGAPAEMLTETKKAMGISYSAFGNGISASGCVLIVTGFGVLFTVLAAAAMFIKRKDR